MPTSLCGTWDMVSNVNFEGYMKALGNVDITLQYRLDHDLNQGKAAVSSADSADSRPEPNEILNLFWCGNKLVCEQIGMNIVVFCLKELYSEGQVCKQVFKKNA
uniref:Cytosolic fatty-acid binding proteins domain-containing protein n=1 Tax=Neogobius melanostomus TaxID=47308 RepID=A0A8C6USV9_9GOBI